MLVYATDRSAPDKHARAKQIVLAAARLDCLLTVQSLGEFYFLTTRKGMVTPREAAAQVNDWLGLFQTASHNPAALRLALLHAAGRRLSFWDAMLLATAHEAGCEFVLSEDMHDGTKFGNLTVRNPFAGPDLPDDVRALLGLDE